MTWQEDLRRLDVQLASGAISLREHRKRREELLAAVSGGHPPGQPAFEGVEPPVVIDRPAQPPAPPSRSAALLATDRPTSAPSPADRNATESIRHPTIHDAPTIVTRAIGPLPSLTPSQRRGVPPLPTRPAPTPPRKPTWLFLALGVFLVLVMIVGATWLLGTGHDTGPAGTTTSPARPIDPANAAEQAEARLPTLPGAANPGNSTLSIDKALQLQLVTQADATLMKSAGAQEIIYRASSDPANSPNGTMLLVIPTPSNAAASKLSQGLRQNLTDTGFTVSPLGPEYVDLVFTGTPATGRVSAVWYSSGPLAVGMGVSQQLSGDPNQLRARLELVRTQVTGAFPAR